VRSLGRFFPRARALAALVAVPAAFFAGAARFFFAGRRATRSARRAVISFFTSTLGNGSWGPKCSADFVWLYARTSCASVARVVPLNG
jgi:hypothetical protein